MAGKRTVSVVISGDSSGAQKALGGLDSAGSRSAAHAQSVGQRIGGAFSKVGNQLGGPLGQVLNTVGDGFDKMGERGMSNAQKIMAAGGLIAGAGAALTLLGGDEKQAQDQLATAIEDTGQAASDYQSQIDKMVASQENFGHSAVDTKGALTVLTEGLQDPKKALADMAVVANLAAAKHESLAAAAGQLVKVYAGNSKVLKQYGITLDSSAKETASLNSAEKAHTTALAALNTAQQKLSDLETIDHGKKKLTIADEIALRNARDNVTKASDTLKTKTDDLSTAQAGFHTTTQNADTALGQLNTRLSGQAAASVDNWGGKLDIAKTKLGDWTADMGQRFGPAITASGTILATAGGALDLYQGHVAKARDAQIELSTQAEVSAGTVAEADASIETDTAAVGDAMDLALGPAGWAILAITAGLAIATKGFGLFGDGAKTQIQPVDDLTSAIQNDSDAIGANTTANISHKLAMNGAYTAAQQLGIPLHTLLQAYLGQPSAIKAVTLATDAGTRAAGNSSERTRALQRDLNSTNPSLVAYAKRTLDGAAASKVITGTLGTMNGQLGASKRAVDEQTQALGANAAQIANLTAHIHSIPDMHNTKVTADNYDAMAKIWAARVALSKIPATVSTKLAFSSNYSIVGAQIAALQNSKNKLAGMRAAGGPVMAGSAYLVGEEGPELFVPRSSGGIVPNFDTSYTAKGAGAGPVGGDINITVNTVVDGEVLHKSLLKLKRHKGGQLELLK